MSYNVINPYQTFYDSTGQPRANGTVTFYVNTTTTLGSIYSDEALTVTQSNPYTLDAFGRITGDVKYSGLMTLSIANSDGSDVVTIDNVATINSSTLSEWQSATTAARASTTTFTVTGDLTTTFIEGQFCKATGGADRIFTVDSSSYSSPNTTVTCRNIFDTSSPPVSSTLHASMDTVYINILSPEPRREANSTAFSLFEYHINRALNIKTDFDALGDGATSDKTQFGYAGAVANRTILIPPGTYYIDNSAGGISVTANNVKFIGIGQPIIKSSTVTQHLFNVTGDGFQIEGCTLQGPGTFVDDTTSYGSLVYVTGVDCILQNNRFIDPPTCAAYFYGSLGSKFIDNVVEGGPSSYVGTAHFGVRGIDSYKLEVGGSRFQTKSGGGQQTQGVFISATAGGTDLDADTDANMHDANIHDNVFLACNNHAVYVNGSSRSFVTNNLAKYIGYTAYVVGHVYASSTKRTGNIVTGNTAYGLVDSTAYGFVLRDSHDCICEDNIIDGAAGGIQIAPNDWNSVLSGNKIRNNHIKNYTDYGIQFIKTQSSMTITECADNDISGNTIDIGTTAAGSQLVTGMGINLNIAQTAATDISFRNKINGNIILTAPDRAILVTNQTGGSIENNEILNPGGATTAANRVGVALQNCTQITVKGNKIIDNLGSPLMSSGIHGNNDTTQSTFINNEILGATSVPIRQCQQASNNSTFKGNRTNTNAIVGTFTATAASTTVIGNNNTRGGSGYTTYIMVVPTNASAATLMGSSKCFYQSAYSDGTSFTLATADATAAAGTETFYYEIIG